MLPGIQQFSLHGKVALITGGSKGLGRAMAEGLASAGADIVVLSRQASDVEDVAGQIVQDYQVRAMGVAADVTDPKQVQAAVDKVQADFSRLDILINNAGINVRGPIHEVAYEDFQRVQQVNVDGVWLCSRAVIPVMSATGGGRIVNLASTLGVVGLQERTPYASSKGAVVQMTRALALELASQNILVNAICPGPFLTPMNEPIADSEQAKKFIVGAVALARWGRLEEIQGAAIFLASEASSYMTGSLLMVDGGWTAR